MPRRGSIVVLLGVALGLVLGGPAGGNAQELSTVEPILKQLATEAADRQKSHAERLAAIRTLGQWGTAQVGPALLGIVDDPDPVIRAEVAKALGWEGNQVAAAALVARLSSPSEKPAVRAAAAAALGQIGASEARDPLLAATGDPDGAVRLASLEALAFGPLRSTFDAVPVLIALLKDEHQPLAARGRAAQGLGEARDPRGVEPLLEALERGPRAQLVPFTAELKTQAEKFAARSRILADIRAWSAQSLGLIRDPRALAALVAATEDPEDYFLRMKALQSLTMLRSPTGIPAFLRALNDPFPLARQAAVQGLVTLKVPEAVDPLIALLADPDADLRIWAAAGLGELGDPKAKEALTRLAADEPDVRVRAAAQEAITRLSTP